MRTEIQHRDGEVLGTFRLKAMPRVDDEVELRMNRYVVESVTWVVDEDSDHDALLVVY